ncbi:plastocyanin/azurin family copper-binding protein [Synechococcus sp. BDU 130192]|uniref:plastocyanin/azurin family copper-binding protein n=1 Tax=Synechococcus sp. BDU 130192 TaxID=2042059 RepID=UPI000C076EED|nr:plastocyanin/azurin family copper-binding protein [Synechococcus sp. BDU 130192]
MVFHTCFVHGCRALVLLGLIWFCLTPAAIALPVPAQQPLQEMQIHLGTASGALRFVPDQLEFVAGQRYKLLLDNPSNQKHYFTAKDFADTSWTQKVEAGKVEVKGAIHELELKPGAIAEWILIPQKTGKFELHCSVPGHAAAGMVGIIQVIADS